MRSPLVSIVMPCRNEAAHVEPAIRDALAQVQRGFTIEVLVAVGPSTDGTRALVDQVATDDPRVRIVDNPAGVVPHGLNAAIRLAQGDFIVRMDAHSRYPSDYVANLTEALVRTGADNVGGVWDTVPANGSHKAWAIARVLSSPLGVGNARFRLGTREEMEVDTVPYGCFRRELFDRIGFFDEELVRNQDDEHNGRIRKAGGRIVLLPQVVIQYVSRDHLTKLWRMYREYGLFKPLVNIKLGLPATARQFAPPLFVAALIGLPVVGLLHGGFFLAWTGLVLLYMAVTCAVSLRIAIRGRRPQALVWLGLAFACVHLAYGFGYLEGLVRFTLLRRRIRPENVRTNR